MNEQKQPDFTSRELRNALAAFPTGVTVVTAQDASGNPVGMTATSFNSVSMDPPLVLWSVTKTSRSAEVFRAASHSVIHVLGAHQTELSNAFAKSGADKFLGIDWQAGANGAPLLSGALARFECAAWATYDGGDHWILVNRVEQITTTPGETLVFAASDYATVKPLAETE